LSYLLFGSFGFWYLSIVSDFGFRASDLDLSLSKGKADDF